MRVVPARFVAYGARDAAAFHATYAGIAERMDAKDAPVIVWGRVPAHLCLGQSQSLADVDENAAVRVVRRPLGGGAVWVDREQISYALIAPRGSAPTRPQDWFAWALAPAIETFRSFGVRAEQHGEDLWVGDRKIAGSGAATIGRAAVVASSFLMRFPAERFARAVAVPTAAFRASLRHALPRAMTDWSEQAMPPTEDALRAAFVAALGRALGWRAAPSRLRHAEREGCAEWLAELREPIEQGSGPRVPDGLKLNAALTLRQQGDAVELVATPP